jgi:hypothetical protein
MDGFARQSDSYVFGSDPDYPELLVTIAPLASIAPPRRNVGIELDFGGFKRSEMLRVLQGFARGSSIPPVRARISANSPYSYSVYDGFHRYYASAAVGYTMLPLVVQDWGLAEW